MLRGVRNNVFAVNLEINRTVIQTKHNNKKLVIVRKFIAKIEESS